MQWSQIIAGMDGKKPPQLRSAFTAMALCTLAYLDKDAYATRLASIFGVTSVTRVGGGSDFEPHILVVTGPGGTVAAVEGTRNWPQWASFASNAGYDDWPTGPGKVYAPFFRLYNVLRPHWISLLAGPGPLYVTGHSLGAVVAALFSRLAQDLGQKTANVLSFGGPKCVDFLWVRAYRSHIWSLDHPLDPIPRAPVDNVILLTNPTQFLRSERPFVTTGTPWSLPAWSGMTTGFTTVDNAQAFIAAAMNSRLSFHQTFQYLRDMRAAMEIAERIDTLPLSSLLLDLGLFDPWPA